MLNLPSCIRATRPSTVYSVCKGKFIPALDFSHSYPVFCHSKSVGNFRMHLSNFGKPGLKTAAGRLRNRRLMNAMSGAAISGLAAVIISAFAQGQPWKNLVPLVFLAVLLVVAGLFGARAGIISTVLAALIFASFLYAPHGSLNIASDSARANLGWMLLIGIAFSFLFAPPTSGLRRH
jgi:Domain of unknown function (DUF4118)